MQEKNVNDLTLRSSSFKEVDHDGGEYDCESPIVGVIVKDEPERSDEHGDGDSDDDDDDDDFEFTFAGSVDRDSDWFPPGEVFPIFDRRLLSETESLAIQNDQMQTVRSTLNQLFIVGGDRNRDEESELDGIAPGSYCVWTPGNSPQASPARCKKSSSTGSTAKRWSASLKELLIRRSRSGDGKASLVRFGNLVKTEKGESAVVKMKKPAVNGGGEKRRATYLPYKKAIIGFGFYPSVNGFGGVNRNRPPF